MSYDLRVWSVYRPVLDDLAPSFGEWRVENGSWHRDGGTWQIVLSGPFEADPEDIPQEVHQDVPGARFLTELSIEPISAPSSALALGRKIARAVATAARGVVEDPQEDTITKGRRVRRLEALGADNQARLISLSWWFTKGSLIDEHNVGELCECLERWLPEALPWRYGLYEPPQHRWDREGREHFRRFFAEHGRSMVVWYSRAPVASVHFGLPATVGPSRLGFRSAYFRIDIDFAALGQPGWAHVVRHAWKRVSELIHPFYGDVRILSNYVRDRGRYYSTIGTTESHPVCSWWWAGIPTGPIKAAVVGAPYLALWTEFADRAEKLADLAFMSVDDWTSDHRDNVLSLRVPADIAQRAPERGGPNANREYPPVWPFESPRTP